MLLPPSSFPILFWYTFGLLVCLCSRQGITPSHTERNRQKMLYILWGVMEVGYRLLDTPLCDGWKNSITCICLVTNEFMYLPLSLSLRVCVVLWHTFCARIDRARSCFPAAGEPNILNVAHRMWWSACMRRYKSRLFRNSASVYFVQDFFFYFCSSPILSLPIFFSIYFFNDEMDG